VSVLSRSLVDTTANNRALNAFIQSFWTFGRQAATMEASVTRRALALAPPRSLVGTAIEYWQIKL
jgi:hypothetical protein